MLRKTRQFAVCDTERGGGRRGAVRSLSAAPPLALHFRFRCARRGGARAARRDELGAGPLAVRRRARGRAGPGQARP